MTRQFSGSEPLKRGDGLFVVVTAIWSIPWLAFIATKITAHYILSTMGTKELSQVVRPMSDA
jgi:hypothetical protein